MFLHIHLSASLLMDVVIIIFLSGGLAEQLYSSLQTPEARLAILLGTAKYNMFSRTSQVLLNRGAFLKKQVSLNSTYLAK